MAEIARIIIQEFFLVKPRLLHTELRYVNATLHGDILNKKERLT